MPTVSRAASAACASAVSSPVPQPRSATRGAADVAFDQREQVEERLRPLAAEPVVLLRVPGVGHRRRDGDAAAALAAGREVEVGRRLGRDLPAEESLVVDLVVRVGGADHLVEHPLERRPSPRPRSPCSQSATSPVRNFSMFSAYFGRRNAPFSMRLTASLSWKRASGLVLRLARVIALPDPAADERHDLRHAGHEVAELGEGELALPGVDDVIVVAASDMAGNLPGPGRTPSVGLAPPTVDDRGAAPLDLGGVALALRVPRVGTARARSRREGRRPSPASSL